jgi:hypothetical protein
MILKQESIFIRQFADMLASAGPNGVIRTRYPLFDIHEFVSGPHAGAVVVEDTDETYVLLQQQSKG